MNDTWLKTPLLALTLLTVACGDPSGTYNAVLSVMSGQTVTKSPWQPAKVYRDAHDAVPVIIDLHADTLLAPDEDQPFERLLTNPDKDGHVDVPRLIQGNVTLQVFAAGAKGSLDTLGNSLPAITGKYVDSNGVERSRYGFERDPNVAAYDDPRDTYAHDYANAPTWMPRDVATYLFRMSGRDCKTWYEDGAWDRTVWGETKPCPGFDPARMYLERYLTLAARLRGADAADGRLTLVKSRTELEALLLARRGNKNLVGALLSTEGLYFRSDVSTAAGQAKLRSVFDELFLAGFRMFSLTHFMDNDHGGSATGMGNASVAQGRDLSPAGMQVAELVLQRGGVLDVAHASRATVASLAQLARTQHKPVVFSHGGLSDIPGTKGGDCNTERNIDAAVVRDIASTGGVIGIGFAKEFVCDTDPSAWARAVRHAVDVIDATPLRLYGLASGPLVRGVEHVALGSDYDGGIKAHTDVANLNQYTRALMCTKSILTPDCLERPFAVDEVSKILGANALAVFRASLPAY
ncbi:MAG: hypothetical protein RLZZ450_4446 [Pseudomonadota bacterium]|jgi:microsomal dipeptidase-like Zn-dependent dipeptidase